MVFIKTTNGELKYIEDIRIRVFQKLRLPPLDERLRTLKIYGWNTFKIPIEKIFIDMLTDSGVNAVSLEQLSDMMGLGLEDAYAGNRAYYKLLEVFKEFIPHKHVVLTHQGRAAENLVFKVLMRNGKKPYVLTNIHFTTTRAIIERVYGGRMIELPIEEAFNPDSLFEFKGNMDTSMLEEEIRRIGRENIAAVRMEYAANLLGGQPFSLKNYIEVREICDKYGIPLVADISMADWQIALMKERDPLVSGKSAAKILSELMELTDISYASARKGFYVRGGFITVKDNDNIYRELNAWQTVFEGHTTYGGMSLKEVAMLIDGIRMAFDDNLPFYELEQIKYAVRELDRHKIPVIKPPGGLGIHIDARRFLPHIPLIPSDNSGGYPAGALVTAVYLVSGIRGMERGQISMDRDPVTFEEIPVKLDVVRFGIPRKTYLKGHVDYLVDRLIWLYEHKEIIKGLKWIYEPPVLRFFEGILEDVGNWGNKLAEIYVKELGDV
ncbi:MAG: tryptophanase [Desulfurococcaceae archaeon]